MENEDKKPKALVIPMARVKSQQISHIGYDADSKTLAVKFLTGTIYHYKDVERELYMDFKDAKSIGTFFAMYIRKLPTEKQPQPPAEARK